MADGPTGAEFSQVSLKILKLRPGMFLQAEGVELPNYEAQFLGMIEDKCLMIVPVGVFSTKFGMRAGESYVIRGFTGQYDFHFPATVIQAFDFTFRTPAYAYAVLTYPEAVEAKKVRNSIRIKTSLSATATPHGSETPHAVTLVDMSVDGALVRSSSTLGAVGELVRLDFSVGSEMEPPNLLTLARICHTHEDTGTDRFLTGVLFETTSGANRVALRDFILSNIE